MDVWNRFKQWISKRSIIDDAFRIAIFLIGVSFGYFMALKTFLHYLDTQDTHTITIGLIRAIFVAAIFSFCIPFIHRKVTDFLFQLFFKK